MAIFIAKICTLICLASFCQQHLGVTHKGDLTTMIGQTFDEVFSFRNLYLSCKKCYKGVNWKTSTQKYRLNALCNVAKTYNELKYGKYKSKGFYVFRIRERGKVRTIKSIHISERVVQKCLCDNCLVPVLSKSLIYDNGACLKGKGLNFTTERLKAHLQQYYRKNNYSNKGFVLTFDFSKFFESIPHEMLKQKVAKKIQDPKIVSLYNYFVDQFENSIGLGLGSQISQISALFYISDFDHYVKERLHIKYYGRYMDDGYLIHHDKEYLKTCLREILRLATEMGLKINLKKTKITKLENGFMFLNRHWHLTEKGYIKTKPSHKTMVRLRRKYRKLKTFASDEQIKTFLGSVSGFLKFYKNERLFNYVKT